MRCLICGHEEGLWAPFGRPFCADVDACAGRIDAGRLVGPMHAALIVRRVLDVLVRDLRDLDPKMDVLASRLVHALAVLLTEPPPGERPVRSSLVTAVEELKARVSRVERGMRAAQTLPGFSEEDFDTDVIARPQP